MECVDLDIDGVRLLRPERYRDHRGFFSEVYNKRVLADVGISHEFVQDNHSLSWKKGTIRGLHFQIDPYPTAKLVRVTRGSVWDVVVDLRHGSPTFGQHVGVKLSPRQWDQLYVPVGCAHGLCTLEPNTEVIYKVSDYWYPEVDKGVLWNDPNLAIEWPIASDEAVVSEKDRSQPRFLDLPRYFVMEGL